TTISGKVVEEDETSKLVERASGYQARLRNADIAQEKWFNIEVDLSLGLDLKGGTALRYRIDLDRYAGDAQETILERTVDTYSARLDKLGVKELSIRGVPPDEIIIELPGVSMEESMSYENIVMRLGRLEYRIVARSVPGVLNLEQEKEKLENHLKDIVDGGGTWTPKIGLEGFDVQVPDGVSYRWFPYTEKTIQEEHKQAFPFVMLEMNPADLFTGEDLERTFVTADDRGRPALGFEIKAARANDFGEFTEKNLHRQMAIVLDGEVSTAPELQSRIDDSGRITGGGISGFTSEEVKTLKTVLESGSLEVKPEKLSKATIGPTLGQASINRSVYAGILAGLAVVTFMAVYYLGVGLISCITLMIGMYLLVGGMAFLGATLTLPGIAGILLTVGMAVDQNILINERIREERKKGKTLGQAVKNGFERAFVTIVDAQATTFIAGFILYQIGTGPVRGFAVTLMLGIVTTMFSALVGSKVLFAIGLERGWFKELKMLSIVGDMNVAFTRYLRVCLILSALSILGGLAVFAKDYHELEGLDFAGGFQAHIRLSKPMRQPDVLGLLKPKYETVQVVSMISETGAAPSEGEGATDFRITIRTGATDSSTNADGDLKDRYLADIEEVLGDRMIPDGVTAIEVTPEANERTAAQFTLNFSGPLETALVQGRLQQQMAVDSVAPVSGSSPADSFRVKAGFSSQVQQDDVRGRVTTSLTDLPNDVRLSDAVPQSQFIGGRVGKELTNSAIKAMVLAIFFILLYIRIRFKDFTWGLAACVAVAHDVLFCLGAVAVAPLVGINIELDLAMVGAFLTLIGYSLNDTIVIFDRVRENLPRVNLPLAEVVNLSINQTMSRTILTGGTTLIAVVILFLLNLGERNVLEGFSFVILVGVIVGTYSTVFIASPLLVWLTERQQKNSGKTRPAKKAPATT
ncbi:MAG: protein translocase subunit SecD, partial [Planctomycetota bacterium]